MKDQVIYVGRVTKVVKGGKNFSFSALVVVGDGNGKVGFGLGKALEVPSAIKKGIESAKRNMIKVPVTPNGSLPHPITGRFGSGSVLMKPAPEGTGVIAGAAVRAIMEAVGVKNVLTKSLGSSNPHNVSRHLRGFPGADGPLPDHGQSWPRPGGGLACQSSSESRSS
jgi:small subunit ribosomal protein S5